MRMNVRNEDPIGSVNEPLMAAKGRLELDGGLLAVVAELGDVLARDLEVKES